MEGEPDKGALDPILVPELFDPATETWRTLCKKPIGRMYHTTAMLLPDARVLVAGHDGALNMPPYDRSRYELELFSPPYLFARDGSPARRPVISRAPRAFATAKARDRRRPQHVASAALIAPSALTHQINPEQRYVGLGINEQNESGVLGSPLPPTRTSRRRAGTCSSSSTTQARRPSAAGCRSAWADLPDRTLQVLPRPRSVDDESSSPEGRAQAQELG